MKILFYGRLAETLGQEMNLAVEAPCSVATLRQRLVEVEPSAADALASGRVRACIRDTIVPESYLIAPHDEVEFFPPVSGG